MNQITTVKLMLHQAQLEEELAGHDLNGVTYNIYDFRAEGCHCDSDNCNTRPMTSPHGDGGQTGTCIIT